MIQFIQDPEEKASIANQILLSLPAWFGIPEGIQNYVEESKKMPFFTAFSDERPVGFLVLKSTSTATAEIFVMGVLPAHHRSGIGKELYEAFERYAQDTGFSYIQVKTVQMGKYPEYDKTNRFYLAMGFQELECFPTLWEEGNPCQVYIKYIGSKRSDP